MRIQPPKTKAKSFNTNSKSFEKYILNHKILYEDGTSENMVDFFERQLLAFHHHESFLDVFVNMWPIDYQPYVKRILLIKFKDYLIDDIVKNVQSAKIK